MTSRVLIVAEHDGVALAGATARVVGAARALQDAEITVAVFASARDADAAAVAAAAASLDGVNTVLTVAIPDGTDTIAAAIAPEVAALAGGYTHVFGPATTFGKDLMPRIAGLLDAGQVSDVIAIDGEYRFRRPIYAGNAIETVEALTAPVVATVRVSAWQAVGPGATPAPIESIEPTGTPPTHTRFVSLQGAAAGRADLQSASRVVTGGRGMASAEGFRRLNGLADLLGAAIGATRAAVDAGFAPNELQVGQTGKVIAPELYLALGVSGAIQHLAGIRDARTIVAVNRDSEAPIFEVADIGLVADLFDVLPELEARIADTTQSG